MQDQPSRQRAARPRDAATLILVDRSAPEPLVLMGRRGAGHSFLPGKWVFPGGRIARQDFGAVAAAELPPGVAAALAETLTPGRARALAVAAIRETFEETGLLLGAAAAPLPRRGAWRAFFAQGVAPDLGALDYIARLITPPIRPKRFDTRFFLADAARLKQREPVDSGELEQLAWFSLAETERLDLATPTKLVLRHLATYRAGAAGMPFFRRFRTASE